MKTSLKKIIWLFLTSSWCLGFRVWPNMDLWEIDASSEAQSKLFVVYAEATREVTNDLPSDDPAAGSGTITIQQLMNSVFNDYNSIQGAFVILTDVNDPDYSAAAASHRTITIELANPTALGAGGQTYHTRTENRLTGCRIVMKGGAYSSAKSYVGTVTHELGHCLGLDHPQDSTNSIMSYFNTNSTVRLQPDDKMGILYLYPTNPEKAKESATMGMSCARR